MRDNKDCNNDNIFTGNKKLAEAVSKIDFNNMKSSVNLSSATMVKPNPTEEIQKIMSETHKKKAQYEADLLNTLKSIEQNTANLGEIVGLIQNSNNQQDEMIELLSEIMMIATATNKEV